MYPKHYLWLSVVLVITCLSLSPNLKSDFLNWDDPVYVVNNDLIKDTSLKGVAQMFTTNEVIGTYSPLVLWSWSIDYKLSELNPLTFHGFNIWYHLLVVVLVFYLALLLTKRIEVAFIAALLFGIHPMHVETVAWISARKDILYAMFFFGALIAYHYYVENLQKPKKWYWYGLCLIVYVLSLFSKGTAVIAPLVLCLIDFLKQRKDLKHLLLEKLPFFLLSIVFVWIAIQGQATEGAFDNTIHTNKVNAIAVGFYGYFVYLLKSVIPFSLSGYHPYPPLIGEQLPWYFYVAATPVIALFIWTLLKAKKERIVAFGILFFFIALIPVIQVLPFGTAVIAERYTYVPYFGLFLLFGIWIVKALDHFQRFKIPIWGLTIVYLLGLGIVSFQYSKDYHNSETFWSSIMAIYSEDHLAYLNRGNYRMTQKRYSEALQDFNRAIHLDSDNYLALYNRGMVYNVMNEPVKAIKDYSDSSVLHPEFASNYLNRGIIFSNIKNYNQAIRDFDKVLSLEPENYKALYNRALAFKSKGMYYQAINDLSKIIELEKIEPVARITRGEILVILGKDDHAKNEFTKVLALDPKATRAYVQRGLLHVKSKAFHLAKKDFEQALRLDNSVIEAHINLGVIMMNAKNYKEAITYFNTAKTLNPKNHIIYYNSGLLQLLLKNYDLAIQEFNNCLKLKPDFRAATKDRIYAIELNKGLKN